MPAIAHAPPVLHPVLQRATVLLPGLLLCTAVAGAAAGLDRVSRAGPLVLAILLEQIPFIPAHTRLR